MPFLGKILLALGGLLILVAVAGALMAAIEERFYGDG
jgi:hypothetical protein